MSRRSPGDPAVRTHGGADGDGRPPPFRVDTVPDGARTHVRPVGEVDIATLIPLERALMRAVDDGCEHIVVDLREVTFMDAGGARLLLEAGRRAARGARRLSLIPGPRPARRVLEMTGALERFELLAG